MGESESGLESVLRSFQKVLIAELNLGQLALLIRGRYLIDVESIAKVQGRPFTSQELEAKIVAALEDLS